MSLAARQRLDRVGGGVAAIATPPLLACFYGTGEKIAPCT